MLTLLSISLVAMAWLWPRLWYRFVNQRVTVHLTLSHRYAELGTAVTLECEVKNQAWLPCPSVEVVIDLPDGLSAHPGKRTGSLRFRTYLLPRQSVRLRTKCYAQARGLQQFRLPAMLSLNEGFGLRTFFHSQDVVAEIVVLPAYVDDHAASPAAKALNGSLELFRWLHPDESLFRGVRPYQYGDPIKHMAWRASATTGQWMVKQYSSSTETTVYLVLNAQLFDIHWYGTRKDEFDALASLAATYARWFESRGFRLQFVANALIPRDPLRQFHGPQSAMGIRLLLGRAEAYANSDFSDLWRRLRATANPHSHVVVFASHFTPAQLAMIRQPRMGLDVTVVPGPTATFRNGSQGPAGVHADHTRKEGAQ
ncbi:MAG: hypothetical protein A2201_02670 [Alicyclobacillus sp. RIFOXYA1_FULL_53_8]|nr:MAG: hypothetical protein A2201_02670 [Alicyclobacillus sp. RIFOXYA1_FULL_53_8]